MMKSLEKAKNFATKHKWKLLAGAGLLAAAGVLILM